MAPPRSTTFHHVPPRSTTCRCGSTHTEVASESGLRRCLAPVNRRSSPVLIQTGRVLRADSYVVSMALLGLIGLVFRLKPSIEEITDVDKSFHGERAYMDAMENDSKFAGTAFGPAAPAKKVPSPDSSTSKCARHTAETKGQHAGTPALPWAYRPGQWAILRPPNRPLSCSSPASPLVAGARTLSILRRPSHRPVSSRASFRGEDQGLASQRRVVSGTACPLVLPLSTRYDGRTSKEATLMGVFALAIQHKVMVWGVCTGS